MKKNFKKLAKKAGFIFWGEEPWKPDNQMIDWSSDYDKELEKFANLVEKKLIDKIKNKKLLTKDQIKELEEE